MQKKIITLFLAGALLSVGQASDNMEIIIDEAPTLNTNQVPVFFNPQQFIPVNGLPSPTNIIKQYQIGKVSIPYRTSAGKKALDVYAQCIDKANERLDTIMEDIGVVYNVIVVEGTNYGSNNLDDFVYFPNELYDNFLKKFGQNNLRYYSEILFMSYSPKISKLESDTSTLEQFKEDIEYITEELLNYQY